MTEKQTAVGGRPIPGTIRHDEREIVLVLEDNGILVTRPAPGVNMEEPDDRSLHACTYWRRTSPAPRRRPS
jgi:hypothetical protein